MADIEVILESLMDEYDNATGTRQVSLDEAIEITEQLIEELNLRLMTLQADKNNQTTSGE